MIVSLEQNNKPKFSYEELKEKYIDRKVKHNPLISKKGGLTSLNIVISFIVVLITLLGLGFIIGYYLDRLLGTKPIFMLICIFLGIAGAFRNLIHWLLKQEDSKNGKAKDEGN